MKVPILLVLFSLVAAACASPVVANQASSPAPIVATATPAADTTSYGPTAVAPYTAPTQAALAPTAPAAPAVPAVTAAPAVPPSAPSAAPSSAPTAAVKLDSNKNLGLLLVTTDGLTLYTFGKDTPGVSNCTESACVAFWPPYAFSGTPAAINGLPGKLSTITRSDGTSQLAYNDMPLYTFALDKKAGDVSGDGLNDFGGIWHVVVTAPAQSTVKQKPRKTTGGGYNPMPAYNYP